MSATGAPAGPGMRADARRNRQRLLDAALQAYTEHGADDASLDEIARRAGVGIGTLYRHFPDRRALLEAVYRDQVEDLCTGARKLQAEAAPGLAGEALERWLRALVGFAATKRNLTSSIMSGPAKSEVATSCSAMIRESVEGLLAEAQRAGAIRPDVDAVDLLRMSHAISIAADLPNSHPDQADRLMAVMLAGLRPAAAQA